MSVAVKRLAYYCIWNASPQHAAHTKPTTPHFVLWDPQCDVLQIVGLLCLLVFFPLSPRSIFNPAPSGSSCHDLYELHERSFHLYYFLAHFLHGVCLKPSIMMVIVAGQWDVKTVLGSGRIITTHGRMCIAHGAYG